MRWKRVQANACGWLYGTEDADGEEEDGSNEGERSSDGDADQAKGEGRQPDDGVKDEGEQRERPAEDQEDAEEEEFEHGVISLGRGLAGEWVR